MFSTSGLHYEVPMTLYLPSFLSDAIAHFTKLHRVDLRRWPPPQLCCWWNWCLPASRHPLNVRLILIGVRECWFRLAGNHTSLYILAHPQVLFNHILVLYICTPNTREPTILLLERVTNERWGVDGSRASRQREQQPIIRVPPTARAHYAHPTQINELLRTALLCVNNHKFDVTCARLLNNDGGTWKRVTNANILADFCNET